ncbi:PepSY domain-containing protein [Saxibacter everestensis]|uniref:PepSY domain-containing protein n=1 Tax=Saxibacter everestensis TaxID=2909229 RepID=A0ABY8QRN4_9MICO|nr:PepSY domain-containing protein [Brevibacteriaceae bacterium ZFBP1038]
MAMFSRTDTQPSWGDALHRPGRKLLLASCLAVALTGCGNSGDDDGSEPAPSSETSTTATGDSSAPTSGEATTQPSAEASLALEDAGAAALKAVPDSTLISIETEERRAVWEVQVVTSDGTEHEMLISRSDGSVTEGPTKEDDDAADKAKHQDRVKAAKLDYRAAAKAMRDAVADAEITELNLDTYRGKTVWEGDLAGSGGTKHSVKIDAASGEVIANTTGGEDDD